MSATIRDLFCGAGGSSLGAELAGTQLKHALNHWDRAVETHATNFQHADHSCADIASLTTAQIRKFDATDILWASPECTNHSLAKGARRRPSQAASLLDDGPAGDAEQDRSRATMWDVVRFCEQACLKGRPYKAIIVENVVDVVKWGYNDDGGLFNAWLAALRALGYEHECVYLNSMFCWPTPQSRDRVYIVLWLRGMRRPELRFEPKSWCPSCAKIVDGRQTWKRPAGHGRLGRPWGRYGPQYFYACPDCRGAVLPAVFPAASIIDWQLAAQRIGDRDRPLAPKTRERIRRGLDRLAREPFAIRLTHGGVPRPLTLPIVTLTRRHDPAMVFPVAGNTFERSPGNRAREAQLVPLDTVHGTLDRAIAVPAGGAWADRTTPDREPLPTQTAREARAMVVPPMGQVHPRVAGEESAPTQTITTRAAVVHPRGVAEIQRHGDVRPIHEAVHTVRAGGQHHAIVMRNNESRGDAGQMCTPAHEPARTFTTAGHQSLVMANRENAIPRPASEVPTATACTGHGCGLALVVPYDSTGEPRAAAESPTQTLTTRDRAAVVFTDEEIDDCLFRMFALHEIAGAMVMAEHTDGSPYQVLGNKRERMAQLGNAVTPPAARELVLRVLEVLT